MNWDAWARGILQSVWPGQTRQAYQAVQAVSRGEGYYGRGWSGDCVGSNNWGAVQVPCSQGGCQYTDTHPTASGGSIAYAACFAVDPTPELGAQRFLHAMLKPPVLAVINSGDAHAIAAAMYQGHYYEGFGSTVEQRIGHYADAILKNAKAIAANNNEPLLLTSGPNTAFPSSGSSSSSTNTGALVVLSAALTLAGGMAWQRRRAA